MPQLLATFELYSNIPYIPEPTYLYHVKCTSPICKATRLGVSSYRVYVVGPCRVLSCRSTPSNIYSISRYSTAPGLRKQGERRAGSCNLQRRDVRYRNGGASERALSWTCDFYLLYGLPRRDRNRAWEAPPPPWDGALGLAPTRGRNTRISQLPADRN